MAFRGGLEYHFILQRVPDSLAVVCFASGRVQGSECLSTFSFVALCSSLALSISIAGARVIPFKFVQDVHLETPNLR